jgi:purine-binding chemotaxis protein CheW
MTTTSNRTPLSETLKTARQEGKSAPLQLVTFGLGTEEFGVDILAVQEINRMMELTRVPQSPADVEGVINLRGRIIPVLDLRKRFGMAVTAHSEASRIIVVDVLGRTLGFIVDRVQEVLRIESSIVEPAPTMACSIDSDYIAGVGKLEDRLLILLDLERLFENSARAGGTKAALLAA